MKEATDSIKLHSKNLTIDTSRIEVYSLHNDHTPNIKQNVVKAGPEGENDIYAVTLAEKLSAGSNYSLFIPFEARLNKGLQGFYPSSYLDRKSKEKR